MANLSQKANKVYPKVRVRQELHDGDGDHVSDLGLKAFLSLSLHPSPSPSQVIDKRVVSMPSIVQAPKCYVPQLPAPRVLVTEDSEDLSDSSAPEKDSNTDENKVNIRASLAPRPRAVISSPDNDIMIGNRNKIRDGTLSASKNGAVLQNRHAHCKVKSHDVTDIPLDTRKHKEPGSKDKLDPVGKKKVHKGSIKSENAPRNWKF